MFFNKSGTKIIISIIVYVIMVAIIIGGIFAFCKYQDKRNEKSETYGSFNEIDAYKNYELWNQDLSDIVFYSEGNVRSFSASYPVSIDFDGENNKYNLLVNKMPCNTEQSTFGYIIGTYDLYFQDFDGSIISSASLEIKIRVYVSKVEVNISTVLDDENFGYLLEYIEVNGFKLSLIDEQYSKKVFNKTIPISLATITITDIPEYVPTEQDPYPEIIPATIIVEYNNITLQKGKDYEVTYSNNRNIGWATATFTGIGLYNGSVIKEFYVWANTYQLQTNNYSTEEDGVVHNTFPMWLMNATEPGREFNVVSESGNKKTLSLSLEWSTAKTVTSDGWKRWSEFKLNKDENFTVYLEFGIFEQGILMDGSNGTFWQNLVAGGHAQRFSVDKNQEYLVRESNDSWANLIYKIKFYCENDGTLLVDVEHFNIGSNALYDLRIVSITQDNPAFTERAEITTTSVYAGMPNPSGTKTVEMDVRFDLNSEQTYYEEFVWDLLNTSLGSQAQILPSYENVIVEYNGEPQEILDEAIHLVIGEETVDITVLYCDQKIMLNVDTDNMKLLDNLVVKVESITYWYNNSDEDGVVLFLVGDEIYSNQIINKNKLFTIPNNPQKDGYTFVGWTIDGENIVDLDNIKLGKKTKFIAIFEEEN